MEEIQAHLRTRLASPEEAETVLSLWLGSARWLNAKGINQWRPEYFNLKQVLDFMDDGSDVYLAELRGEIVGTYVLTWSDPVIWQELDTTDAGYIHRFAVERNHRARGIGSSLLQSAEAQIYQKGKRYARLDCMADNPRLNQYYRSHGFQWVRRMELDKNNWSANLYEKRPSMNYDSASEPARKEAPF